ncbi:uncharacterized protein J3D65DRAFT_668173 [Phyllosticta citribraziliensis]|uniref:Uncharacterized protein n=1 Tax=Phyllosticta citribraziliensis TaxID=989973 RepID=A0ABR1LS59_9PEZI
MPPTIKQTLKQAKADYKKYGPRVSEKDKRQLERGIELDRRAEGIKERERRRKDAEKKRREKEAREKETRRSMGVGRATQLAGFNHTQKQLKGAMESFLGLGKKQQQPERDNDIVDAPAEDLLQDDGLLDSDEYYWNSSPLDASVHSQDAGGRGEGCAGPAPHTPEKRPGNLAIPIPQTRAGEASTTMQSVANPMHPRGETPSNTPCGQQDAIQQNAPGAKSSQSDMWDDTLDDATILSALKGKTPTSQAARQCSQVPMPMLHEPASPCERVRSESEPAHLSFERTEHCNEKVHSLTQVDDDPLAAIDIDCLDDLFPSNSQIQRELTPPRPPQSEKSVGNFIKDDLEAEERREIELSSRAAQPALVPASRSRPQQQPRRPHGAPPFHVKSTSDPRSFDAVKQSRLSGSIESSKPAPHPSTHTKMTRSRPSPLATSKSAANIDKSSSFYDDAITPCPRREPNISATFPKMYESPGFKKPSPALPCSKRKIHDERTSSPLPPVKKLSARLGESRPSPSVSPSASAAANKPWTRPDLRSTTTTTSTTPSRFRDFGLSTQIISDAIDDDVGLSP